MTNATQDVESEPRDRPGAPLSGESPSPPKPNGASEAVRLERLDDSLNKLRVLMQRWGHLGVPRMALPDIRGWEDELE
jgi:hypothetical protein